MHGLNAVSIKVNKKKIVTAIWNNCEVDLSEYLKIGENVIELTLVNNLRNLLGPHHLEQGESYRVRPSSFFKGSNIWLWNPSGPFEEWNDGYCFVETSLL